MYFPGCIPDISWLVQCGRLGTVFDCWSLFTVRLQHYSEPPTISQMYYIYIIMNIANIKKHDLNLMTLSEILSLLNVQSC